MSEKEKEKMEKIKKIGSNIGNEYMEICKNNPKACVETIGHLSCKEQFYNREPKTEMEKAQEPFFNCKCGMYKVTQPSEKKTDCVIAKSLENRRQRLSGKKENE